MVLLAKAKYNKGLCNSTRKIREQREVVLGGLGEYMTDVQRRRAKNRRKFARNVRRTARNVLLMPGKIPPITMDMVEVAMRVCEVVGVLFVISLIANLVSDSSAVSMINLVMGVIFAGFLLFIKFAGYQDRLIREDLSNYIYIR